MFGKKSNDEDTYKDLVIIFSTGNMVSAAIAKSILEDSGIPYITKNEYTQGLFGLGNLGSISNPLSGPVQIFVKPEDVEVVKELLKNIEE
jgi:hypothetical protein